MLNINSSNIIYKQSYFDYRYYGHHTSYIENARFLEHKAKFAPVLDQIDGGKFKLRTLVHHMYEVHGGSETTKEKLISNACNVLDYQPNEAITGHVSNVVNFMGQERVKNTCQKIIKETEGGFLSQFAYIRKQYVKDKVFEEQHRSDAVMDYSDLEVALQSHVPGIVKSLERAFSIDSEFFHVLTRLNDFCLISDNVTFLASSQILCYVIGMRIVIPALKVLVEKGTFKSILENVLIKIKPDPIYRIVTSTVFRYTAVSTFSLFGGYSIIRVTGIKVEKFVPGVDIIKEYFYSQVPKGDVAVVAKSGSKALQDIGYYIGEAAGAAAKGFYIAIVVKFYETVKAIDNLGKQIK